jgi:beta-lactamase regulating signal transducer with metallopeptidase domain
VILTVLFAIVLFYFIKAGRNLYFISQSLQEHYKESEEFVFELKERLENNMFFRLFFPLAPNRKKRTKKATK